METKIAGMSNQEALVKIVTFCFAFGATVAGLVVALIQITKERSAGATALKKLREEFEQFKKDTWEMFFKK